MKGVLLGVVGILLSLATLSAQTANADAWPVAQRPIADYLSTAILAADVGIDVFNGVRRELGTTKSHELRAVFTAVGCDGLKYGAVNGGALALKALLPRNRPDYQDPHEPDPRGDSFSEHTANAFAALDLDHSQKSFWITLAIAAVVMELRGGANKHDWPGRLEGLTLGVGSKLGVRLIPACKGVS